MLEIPRIRHPSKGIHKERKHVYQHSRQLKAGIKCITHSNILLYFLSIFYIAFFPCYPDVLELHVCLLHPFEEGNMHNHKLLTPLHTP